METVEAADPQRGSVSEDGTTALVTIVMDAEPGELPTSAYKPFLEIVDETTTDHVQVEMSGDSMREVSAGGGGSSSGLTGARLRVGTEALPVTGRAVPVAARALRPGW